MGQVSDAVKGSGPPPGGSAPKSGGNLCQQVQGIADEISRLTAIKDDDAMKEGADAKPENLRKAATLRAAYSLLRGAKALLEDY